MTDCLNQLRELKYVYDNLVSQGGAQLQLDTYKLFKNTRVWISTMNEGTDAVWMTHKKDGTRWLHNIIIELNAVIKQGARNQKRVILIASEMSEQERNFASTSVTEYFKKLKEVAHANRTQEKNFKDSQKIFHSLRDSRDTVWSPLIDLN
jgi:hypothetical protein